MMTAVIRPENASRGRPPGCVFATAVLVIAGTWLVAHGFVGLDFMDEMQYYGEIAGLARTGKLFHDDLFIQQLGYVFVAPLFRLHRLAFPDQSYLVLFGRGLLLTGYVVVAALLWRTLSRDREYQTPAKLFALATFLSWIPFQLFALSYNTGAYLLMVAIVAICFSRQTPGSAAPDAVAGALLTMLLFVHPPAGAAFVVLVVGMRARHRQWRHAATVLAFASLGTLLTLAVVWRVHGENLIRDLRASLEFSRTFSVGYLFALNGHFAGWLALVVASAFFIWRMRRGARFQPPLIRSRRSTRWSIAVALAAAAAGLLLFAERGPNNFFVPAGCLALVLIATVLAAPVPSADAPTRPGPLGVVLGLAAVTAALGICLQWETGYFAICAYILLLVQATCSAPPEDWSRLADLALVGTVAGSVFTFASGNGLPNFGVGAAAVLPFLVLPGVLRLSPAVSAPGASLGATALLAAVPALLVINGWRHPYHEARDWSGFAPIREVPAFRGIWTSPVKREAIRRFRALPDRLAGQRLLVAGPQPWLYFVFGAEPATPMFFMHFSGGPAADAMIAEQLFQAGEPDAILVASGLPPPVHARIARWLERECRGDRIVLPAEFVLRYRVQTWYDVATEIWLFRRQPPAR